MIERVSELTGKILMRNPPIPVEVKAYIPGKVSSVLPSTGAVVEAPATFIQGIFGVGGETHGKTLLASKSPKEPLTVDSVNSECAGKILVAGTSPDLKALRKAVEVGVKGIISGGVDQKVLADFIGYELGVAITGHEEAKITLIVTEGFGEKMTMASDTFRLLEKFEGVEASINGATQIRAGVIRPEIIIPRMDIRQDNLVQYDAEDTEALSAGLRPGVPIRIIAAPYFGALAHVVSLPPELRVVETESEVRVLTAELENGQRVIVPRANVEIIGE